MAKSYRILVVDDEAVFRNNLLRMLNAKGYEAEGAASGEDALQAVSQGDFDVVLLDLKMPGMSGEDVLKGIRESGSDAEIIVLTGHVTLEGGVSLIQEGAFDYQVKPITQALLLDSIKLACEERELKRLLDSDAAQPLT
ncbi:response regulator [Oceanidesulfovibrio indonesiensis]|jgi:DNA-binding NtrC family response regulator|uniref:Response regulator n=1 Tax=Oceanidesulfovibrio indonesiensis TaxID=54767 RepID=A0A7M3MAC0_9BACT|nr:response regulator [Oceanidesulfovibrio indonesiensis]TVM14582.1 response regulator [Oceanidesulfovibrio indonesiensis]